MPRDRGKGRKNDGHGEPRNINQSLGVELSTRSGMVEKQFGCLRFEWIDTGQLDAKTAFSGYLHVDPLAQ